MNQLNLVLKSFRNKSMFVSSTVSLIKENVDNHILSTKSFSAYKSSPKNTSIN